MEHFAARFNVEDIPGKCEYQKMIRPYFSKLKIFWYTLTNITWSYKKAQLASEQAVTAELTSLWYEHTLPANYFLAGSLVPLVPVSIAVPTSVPVSIELI